MATEQVQKPIHKLQILRQQITADNIVTNEEIELFVQQSGKMYAKKEITAKDFHKVLGWFNTGKELNPNEEIIKALENEKNELFEILQTGAYTEELKHSAVLAKHKNVEKKCVYACLGGAACAAAAVPVLSPLLLTIGATAVFGSALVAIGQESLINEEKKLTDEDMKNYIQSEIDRINKLIEKNKNNSK